MTVHKIPELEKINSTQFKRPGWRGVLEELKKTETGALMITSHDSPQGVLVTTEHYTRLVELAEKSESQDQKVLETLRQEFDERLAGLKRDDAAARMRKAVKAPIKFQSVYKAGDGH